MHLEWEHKAEEVPSPLEAQEPSKWLVMRESQQNT